MNNNVSLESLCDKIIAENSKFSSTGFEDITTELHYNNYVDGIYSIESDLYTIGMLLHNENSVSTEGVKEVLEGIINSIKNIIQKIIEAIINFSRWCMDTFRNLIGKGDKKIEGESKAQAIEIFLQELGKEEDTKHDSSEKTLDPNNLQQAIQMIHDCDKGILEGRAIYDEIRSALGADKDTTQIVEKLSSLSKKFLDTDTGLKHKYFTLKVDQNKQFTMNLVKYAANEDPKASGNTYSKLAENKEVTNILQQIKQSVGGTINVSKAVVAEATGKSSNLTNTAKQMTPIVNSMKDIILFRQSILKDVIGLSRKTMSIRDKIRKIQRSIESGALAQQQANDANQQQQQTQPNQQQPQPQQQPVQQNPNDTVPL